MFGWLVGWQFNVSLLLVEMGSVELLNSAGPYSSIRASARPAQSSWEFEILESATSGDERRGRLFLIGLRL